MGSPCRSVFTFILMSCRRDLSLVSTFLSSLLSILLRKKNLITDGIRWNPIPWFRTLLLPQPKLNKEPFLLSHSHFTSFYRGRGGLMVSALDSGRVVRVRALDGVIVLCSQARNYTLIVLLFTHVFKWVPANMLGVTLRWTSIPCRGEYNLITDEKSLGWKPRIGHRGRPWFP